MDTPTMPRLPTYRFGLALASIVLGGCSSAPSSPTTFLISSDRELSVRKLVLTARILNRYRDLTEGEVADVERRLQRVFDDLVTLEFQQMVKAEAQRAKTEGRPARRITRADARTQLLARLGKDLALPVLAEENHSVVAFGRVQEGKVEVTRTAYQVDTPATANAITVQRPDGGVAKLVTDP